MIQLCTLEYLPIHDLTSAWNRCWQGYFHDLTYDIEHLNLWLNLGQVSLKNSISLLSNEQVAGFSLLAFNGHDGWIAGTAIDPDHRGKGLFKQMMTAQLAEAKRIRLKRVFLEVLSNNIIAIQSYKDLGFKYLRVLNSYRVEPFENQRESYRRGRHLFEVQLEDYFNHREINGFNPSWQRREHYLKRYLRLKAFINSSGTSGFLLTGELSPKLLDIWTSMPHEVAGLIYYLFQYSESFNLINQPRDWLSAYLASKISPESTKLEMCYDIPI
ncbi:MAG: GNAT family N-acetyltransferase [Desulfitobacterium hafniense]|nr:GNAT family N-acetyltransferase [Desulfitobacterium hafniense]